MYKELLPSLWALLLQELKLSGAMAHIEQNSIVCDSKKKKNLYDSTNKLFMTAANLQIAGGDTFTNVPNFQF